MANFANAFVRTNKNEGGYSNNSHDKGGETYGGITRRFFPAWEGWKLIDTQAPTIKINNARFVMADQLLPSFYKINFWDKMKLDLITDQTLAECIYDFAITSGISDAIKLIQSLVGAEEDGLLGSITLATISKFDSYNLLVAYCNGRILHYGQEAMRLPGNKIFLKGWWLRVVNFI